MHPVFTTMEKAMHCLVTPLMGWWHCLFYLESKGRAAGHRRPNGVAPPQKSREGVLGQMARWSLPP